MRDGDVEGVFFFVVEEGEAIEPDHPVCDAAFAEAFADSLCHTNYNLN